jgi:hypothetical protein
MCLFKALQFNLDGDTFIYCDNKQTIRLFTIETPKLETKLKYVDIYSCWLRQEVQRGSINIKWIPTDQMIADGFTKELGPQKHAYFIKQLNMVQVQLPQA